jgi:hypothetical protein
MGKILAQLISIFLGFTFWGAGMVKLYAGHRFIGWIGPPWLVERMEDYELGFFAEFIAVCQITIGFMLLTTRFKLLGSIMLFPMILNILMVTISQNWTGTPYVLAVLLLMNFYLLCQYRDFFRPLLDEGKNAQLIKIRKEKSWKGHLTWLAGWGLQLLSVQVSFQNLTLAFVTSGIGVFMALLGFKVDTNSLNKIPADSKTNLESAGW